MISGSLYRQEGRHRTLGPVQRAVDSEVNHGAGAAGVGEGHQDRRARAGKGRKAGAGYGQGNWKAKDLGSED